jgi:hypothetical protein
MRTITESSHEKNSTPGKSSYKLQRPNPISKGEIIFTKGDTQFADPIINVYVNTQTSRANSQLSSMNSSPGTPSRLNSNENSAKPNLDISISMKVKKNSRAMVFQKEKEDLINI